MSESKGRILVVDDEMLVRESIADMLAETGFEVAGAGSVEDALARHAETPCDVMLVDKNLPGESGLDLVRRVRAAGDLVPVVLMTGYGSVDSAIDGLHLRISAYLEKPFPDIYAVAEVLKQVLRKGREAPAAGGASGHFRRGGAMPRTSDEPGGEDRAAAAAPGVTPAADAGRPLAILVVAPAAADRRDVARVAARGDDTVLHAATAAEGLVVIARARPDLVLVDAGVTAPDVFAFLERVQGRERTPLAAVIAHQPTLALVARLMRLDVGAILEKPLDDVVVRERLDPILSELRRRTRA